MLEQRAVCCTITQQRSEPRRSTVCNTSRQRHLYELPTLCADVKLRDVMI
jgi:hypothetical protein